MAWQEVQTDASDLQSKTDPPVEHVANEDDEPRRGRRSRGAELSQLKAIAERLKDVFTDVERGFQDQQDRANDILDNWDAYNCTLNESQAYNGNSRICVSFIADAVDARKTRFTNQMFPQSGRNVECVSTDDQQPTALLALMEHYLLKASLKTEVTPALCVNGDVEGQYNLYVSWNETERHVCRRVMKQAELDGVELPGEENAYEDMLEEELLDCGPDFEVLNDADVLILPATCNSVRKAIEIGGSVTIKRRWTKTQIREMIEAGEIRKSPGEILLEVMTKPEGAGHSDVAKKMAKAAGIKAGGGGGKYAIGYETWLKLKVDGVHRLSVARYCGELLGAQLCPYWSDLEPIISKPVEKVAGIAKGRPPVAKCVSWQVFANDMTNAGADTAYFSAMPIIAADPAVSPGPLILGLAAIWKLPPDAVKFMSFPALWKDSQEIVGLIKQQIQQSLGVNPAMMPQSTGVPRAKRNQAEIALEQQVDLLTTADAVSTIEEVYSEALMRVAWYDHQYRQEEIAVRQYGELGMRAEMETIPPMQMGTHYVFRWLGVESARNAAMLQQQLGFLNILKAIPPTALKGYTVDLAPAIVHAAQQVFGYSLSSRIIRDMRYEQSVDPELENKMLAEGFDVMVHPGDDDPKHLQSHMKFMNSPEGSPHRDLVMKHMQLHQMQMQAKNLAQAQQQQAQQPQQGGPQGPQPGAAPQAARPMRGPPGQIAPEQMSAAGAPEMPRKY